MFVQDPDLDFLPIPDPGSSGQAPDPGSQIRIRNTGTYIVTDYKNSSYCLLYTVLSLVSRLEQLLNPKRFERSDPDPGQFIPDSELRLRRQKIPIRQILSQKPAL
jgi:hypothetical protein